MSAQLPPHSVESEEAVLGSILIDPSCLPRIKQHISGADFFIVKNQWVFEAIDRLRAKGMPIDFRTIMVELANYSQLDEIGGPAYISQLVNSVPTALHADGYAQIVKSHSVSRGLLEAASKIAVLAYDGEMSADQKMSGALSELKSRHSAGRDDIQSIGEIGAECVTTLEDWAEHTLGVDEVRGISTGYPSLDMLTGGFMPEEQTVIAARTGVGKSALAFKIAYNVACTGRKVVIFSLEMASRMIAFRLISKEINTQYSDMLRGNLTSEGWTNIYRAMARLESIPLYISRTSYVSGMESKIAMLEDVDLFVVDHLRLVRDRRKDENEVSRLGRVSMELRQIARDYKTHCLLLTQLNRGVDGRDDKRPTLADIRQSGEVEENADTVWGMYRDPNEKSIICVSPLKNRNGEAGIDVVSELRFDARYMDFSRADVTL
jgi:replicative DNA helicase